MSMTVPLNFAGLGVTVGYGIHLILDLLPSKCVLTMVTVTQRVSLLVVQGSCQCCGIILDNSEYLLRQCSNGWHPNLQSWVEWWCLILRESIKHTSRNFSVWGWWTMQNASYISVHSFVYCRKRPDYLTKSYSSFRIFFGIQTKLSKNSHPDLLPRKVPLSHHNCLQID